MIDQFDNCVLLALSCSRRNNPKINFGESKVDKKKFCPTTAARCLSVGSCIGAVSYRILYLSQIFALEEYHLGDCSCEL
jgi:hypothetical protein